MINLNDNNKKMKAEKIANAIISIAEHNGMPYHELQTEALRMTIKQELDRYASTKAEEVKKISVAFAIHMKKDILMLSDLKDNSRWNKMFNEWYTQYKDK